MQQEQLLACKSPVWAGQEHWLPFQSSLPHRVIMHFSQTDAADADAKVVDYEALFSRARSQNWEGSGGLKLPIQTANIFIFYFRLKLLKSQWNKLNSCN